MHTYYVFHFTHLHVSVPSDHLQGAFCYRIHSVKMCKSTIQVFIVIWSKGRILCCMLEMLKRKNVVTHNLNTEPYTHRYTGHIRHFNILNIQHNILPLFHITINGCIFDMHILTLIYSVTKGTLKMVQRDRNM
jgi:hypothetical protein